jgi:hypothetical protein
VDQGALDDLLRSPRALAAAALLQAQLSVYALEDEAVQGAVYEAQRVPASGAAHLVHLPPAAKPEESDA